MALQFSAPTEGTTPTTMLTQDDAGRLVVPESALLFNGMFSRSGSDLIIANEGTASLRVEGYFSAPEPADLFDPVGAMLRGELVERLAGPIAPAQYAQAGPAAGPGPIGQVETTGGGASVQRVDGTVQELQVGMKIFQNDVIQTDAAGSVSVTFVDGTIFTLAAGSRMVIDELIYDPASSDNSGSFSLIQGSFVFIAGQVAKTGGMDVNTPASTMGIRGTTVVVQISNENGVSTSEITLATDPDGGQGRVELFDLAGNLITTITDVETKWVVSALSSETRQLDRTSLDDLEDGVLISAAFAAYRSALSRIDAGDTFVTLGDPLDRRSSDPADSFGDAPGGLGVDSIDEPQVIDPPRSVPIPQENRGSGSFDEGFLQSPQVPVITVAGFEDATVASTISGTLSLIGLSPSGLRFALLAGPQNGVAVISPTGSFRFIPNPDFNGADSFTFSVIDARGETREGRVVVEVRPVNDAPVTADLTLSTAEDSVFSGLVSASDIDGDSLAYSLAAGPANGTVTLAGNGAFTYTPRADFAGEDVFTVRVADPSAAFADSVVRVSVAPVEDALRVTSSPSAARGALSEGAGPLSATGTLAAIDPDSGVPAIWSGTSAGRYGTLAVSPSGTWTYTLDPVAALALAAGEVFEESFVLIGDAGREETLSVPVTIVLTGTNTVPIITTEPGAAEGTVVEGAELSVARGTLSVSDPDAVAGVTWTGVSSATLGTFTIGSDGEWLYALDNAKADGLDAGETLIETFVVTATDAEGAAVTQTVQVTVIGTNDLPIVTPGVVFETTGSDPVTGALTAVDLDANGPLTFAAVGEGVSNGTLLLNTDGTFEYTPDPGFLGVDTIAFSVTDVDGGVTFGTATVEVESAVEESELFRVSAGISRTATPDTAAHAVEIDVEVLSASAINVAFLLDGSGSIGAANWRVMRDAVDTAVSELQEQFAGTSTTVDLKFVTFSSVAKPFGPFDLYDPGLSAIIAALPYDGRATNWHLALDEAAAFFFSEPSSEPNFLLFITDGRPSSGAWVGSLAALQNPTDDVYVNIQAFGFGDSAVLAPLQTFEAFNYPPGEEPPEGPDRAEFLTSPEQLADALRGTPVFDPDLLSLRVTLTAGDGTETLLATETHIALLTEGTNFELPLASIENIALLLGESNRISIRAQFDIDRNSDTAEIDIFTTELIGKATEAQELDGFGAADLLFGSDFSDRISGGAGNDVILGFDGADLIDGGAGADTVLAGAGDDTILVTEASDAGIEKLDGGLGRDTLKLDAAGDLDTLLGLLDIKGIEVLDIDNGRNERLNLDISDLFGATPDADGVLENLLASALPGRADILGNAGDTLVLEHGAGITVAAGADTVTDDKGNALDLYEFRDPEGNILATLGVDTDIVVETVVA